MTGELKPAYTLWTAAAIVALYLVLTMVMFWDGDATADAWERRLLIYNGFTAFAMTAAGVLLGTTIQQANVNAAKAEAEVAKAETAETKEGIKRVLAEEPEGGESLARGIGSSVAGTGGDGALRRRLVDLL